MVDPLPHTGKQQQTFPAGQLRGPWFEPPQAQLATVVVLGAPVLVVQPAVIPRAPQARVQSVMQTPFEQNWVAPHPALLHWPLHRILPPQPQAVPRPGGSP